MWLKGEGSAWREHRDYGKRAYGFKIWKTGGELEFGRKMWRVRAPWFKW